MAHAPSRWELLLERRPVPLTKFLLGEAAKLVAKDLTQWPLPVAELDLSTGSAFVSAFEPGHARPRAELFHEAFRLADWELKRELEAYDEYMRNRRWVEVGLSPSEKTVLLLVSRWLVEQMLSLGEATQGRVKRPQLCECLKRIEELSAGSGPVSA